VIVVVGGASRKSGKTAVAAGLIRSIPEARWTAIKITHHPPHGGDSLQEETSPTATDSGRYLAAGAERSFCLHSSAEMLASFMPRLSQIIGSATNVLIESNSILEHLHPDLYLLVADPLLVGPNGLGIKPSARRFLPAAHAVVWIKRGAGSPNLELPEKPHFWVEPPSYTSQFLSDYVRRKLTSSGTRGE
jgi:Molybdopterin-guanine dinucleotide biosynthesis protein